MDMFLIRSIAYANYFRGVVDQYGEPRRIRANEKMVLKAVAEGMVCSLKLRDYVSSGNATKKRREYDTVPVVGELIELLENNSVKILLDGACVSKKLDKNTMSDIAVRCSLSYRQASSIIRRLIGFGALKVNGDEITVDIDKIEKRDDLARKRFI